LRLNLSIPNLRAARLLADSLYLLQPSDNGQYHSHAILRDRTSTTIKCYYPPKGNRFGCAFSYQKSKCFMTVIMSEHCALDKEISDVAKFTNLNPIIINNFM